MKKLFYFAAALFASAVLFTGCDALDGAITVDIGEKSFNVDLKAIETRAEEEPSLYPFSSKKTVSINDSMFAKVRDNDYKEVKIQIKSVVAEIIAAADGNLEITDFEMTAEGVTTYTKAKINSGTPLKDAALATFLNSVFNRVQNGMDTEMTISGKANNKDAAGKIGTLNCKVDMSAKVKP